jgi:hypothetical protein
MQILKYLLVRLRPFTLIETCVLILYRNKLKQPRTYAETAVCRTTPRTEPFNAYGTLTFPGWPLLRSRTD